MRAAYRNSACLALMTLVTLAGCAGRQERVVMAPPSPPAQVPMPTPPQGATANMALPPLGADGRRVTPNRNLSAMATLWHVRMALNVAALSCRSGADSILLSYNQFLKTHKATLARANVAVDTEFKGRFGPQAIPQRETINTRVYNFFALPPVQQAFCERATMVGGVINSMTPADLAAYAPSALASMEQPFTDFYDAYAAYQTQLAQWRRGTTTAALTSAPVATVAVAAPRRLAIDMRAIEQVADDEVVGRHNGGAQLSMAH